MVKRLMDGLHECFELQTKSLNKKIDVRNKKIQVLQEELIKLKDEFTDFKKNSTMDAYFAKHTDLVDRRGRQSKDYMKDLVKTVEDYLGNQDSSNQTTVDEQREMTKDIEPSGVDTLLLQLQIQGSREQGIPAIQENALASVEGEKHNIMDNFKKALNQDASKMRYLIERHIKSTAGMIKPTKDSEAQTLTFRTIQDNIIEAFRVKFEEDAALLAKELDKAKNERFKKDLKSLEDKNASLREKLWNMQKKLQDAALTTTTPNVYIDAIKIKISEFFNKKLGKKQQYILEEFNEKVLLITAESEINAFLQAKQNTPAKQREMSEASKARSSNKFEHLIKSSERGLLNGEDQLNNFIKKKTSLLMSSQEGSIKSMKFIKESDQEISKEILDEYQNEKKQTRKKGKGEQKMVDSDSDEKSEKDKYQEEEDYSSEEEVQQKIKTAPKTKTPTPKADTPALKLIDAPSSKVDETKLDKKDAAKSKTNMKKEEEQSKLEENKKNSFLKQKASNDLVETSKADEERENSPSTSILEDAVESSPTKTSGKTKQGKTDATKKSPITKKTSDSPPRKEQKAPSKLKDKKGSDANLKPSANPQNQDEAPPANIEAKSTVRSGLVTFGNEKDNRTELIEQLKAIDIVVSDLKEHQKSDPLKTYAVKAENVIKLLTRVISGVDVANKIVLFNSSDSDMVEATNKLKARTVSLSDQLDAIQGTREKIRLGQEMHKLIYSISKFLKDKDTKNAEKQVILTQLVKLDQVMAMAAQLPQIDEVTQILNMEKKGKATEKELNEILSMKLLSGPGTAHSGVPVTATGTASQRLQTGRKDEITDAIDSLKLVKDHIAGSHEILLNSKDVSKEDQKIQSHVKKLMKNMQEAIEWLKKSREVQANGNFEFSSDLLRTSQQSDRPVKKTPKALPDREKVLRLRNAEASKWSNDGGSIAPKTPPPDQGTAPILAIEEMNELLRIENDYNESAEFAKRKQSEPMKQSAKMIKVREDAMIYLQTQDMKIVTEASREAEASRISYNHRSNSTAQPAMGAGNENLLGQIGEVVEIETTEGGNINDNRSRENGMLSDDSAEDVNDSNARSSQAQVGNKIDKSSRIEVFRKTPSIIGSGPGDRKKKASKMNSSQNQEQPMILADDEQYFDQNHIGDTRTSERHGKERKQLAELLQMEKTQRFDSPVKGENFPSRVIQKQTKKKETQKDSLANLRQSVPETDYLQTASHFGNQTMRTDLKGVDNVYVKTNETHLANETGNFLMNLDRNIARDQKAPKHIILVKPDQIQIKTRPDQLNADIQAAQNVIYSQDSDGDIDFKEDLQQKNLIRQEVQQSQDKKHQRKVGQKMQREPRQNREKVPSGLMINAKSYTEAQQIQQQNINIFNDVSRLSVLNPPAAPSQIQMSYRINHGGKHSGVLMLTQETQTENRSLIKYLLTLINETMMKQLEEQSIRMTKNQFEQTVDQFKQVIPTVYNAVKNQSDTFFIAQQLGPSYTTANQQILNEDLNQSISERDPIHFVDNSTTSKKKGQSQSQTRLSVTISNSHRDIMVGRNSLSPVKNTLNNNGSQPRLKNAIIGPILQNSPNNARQPKIPFLSLGDFSRYGNHTLELAQEIKTRVNLKHVGGIGGGFMGQKVKMNAPLY